MTYSDDDKRRILRESRETIARIDAALDDRRIDDADLNVAHGDKLAEWRQFHAEQEARFAAERRRERREHRLDTRMLTVADVQTLIAAALTEERSTVIPVIRQALDELLDQEREHYKSEVVSATRGLELQIARLENALSALQATLASEHGKAIDLPNPL